MDKQLNSSKPLTLITKNYRIFSWKELLAHIKKLPYGRNSNRSDFSLVLKEQKGSCSSKHAFLKTVADENNIKNIELVLGIYKMNANNTNIGTTISDADLDFIPEAHCYLKINGIRTDVTLENSCFSKIENVILKEIKIEPHQVAEFKIDFHKDFIKDWIIKDNINKSFDEIWNIREQCITFLSRKTSA